MWPASDMVENVTDHQRAELAKATTRRFGLLLGTPGTGKSHAAAALLRAAAKTNGVSTIAVCAPTGKAAVRCTAAMRQNGLSLEATTIHKLLGMTPEGFQFNAKSQLPQKFFVIDESSMLDADLAAALFSAIMTGSCVLLVGDCFQLPPVGHGAPLRDLQAAGLPCGLLTEVLRNGGLITAGCALVKDGKRPKVAARVDLATGQNLRLAYALDPTGQRESLGNLVATLRDKWQADPTRPHPVWDVQVLVAANRKGELSRRPLNDLLQGILNPPTPERPKVSGTPFRIGDKVINLRNDWLLRVEMDPDFAGSDVSSYHALGTNNKLYAANGELAEVLAVESNRMVVRFDGPPRLARVPLGKDLAGEEEEDESNRGRGCSFDLGYAVTTHKCVHPDTLVETAQGLLPICLIAQEGCIAGPEGRRKYGNKVSNPVGPALTIECEDGYQVTVTPDHKVECWDGERFTLRDASTVLPETWMRVRLGATIEPSQPCALPPLPVGDVRSVRYATPAECDEPAAEFFGLMVADGCVFGRGFRLLKRHDDVAARFGELCRTLFAVDPRPVSAVGATGFEVHSTLLTEWLRRVGGMEPNAKAIPECVLRSTLRVQAAFLRGLFEDGTVNVRGGLCDHVEFTTVYESIARTVQVMLARLGMIAAVKRGQRIHHVYLYGAHAGRFAQTVGFVSSFKNERLKRCITSERRYRMPIGPAERALLWPHLEESDRGNIRTSGYASRSVVQKAPELADRLQWHYVRVRSIVPTHCESMCVTVPDGHQFLQNGFPHGNSQGSQWHTVLILIDSQAQLVSSREWHYTAISRAEKLCILIGSLDVLEKQSRRQVLRQRKTFLKELLTGV